jgi:hypothetical protein
MTHLSSSTGILLRTQKSLDLHPLDAPRNPMPRFSSGSAMVAGAMVLVAACSATPTDAPAPLDQPLAFNRGQRHGHHGSSRDALVLEDPTTIAQIVNPVTGDTVDVNNGGFGSAIALDPWQKGVYYLLTDRGPNIAFQNGIAFPAPDFSPQIGVFHRERGTLIRNRTIKLKDSSCNPLTGLPIPSGSSGSTGEIGRCRHHTGAEETGGGHPGGNPGLPA